MSNEIVILVGTSVIIGFTHTILGPDHYLPFIVLSRSRQWNTIKTVAITLLCGIGHIFSSVILGFIGIAIEISIFKLKAIESFREGLSAWLLVAFGFTYFIWGMHTAIRYKPHEHLHIHKNGNLHSHNHSHIAAHSHLHVSKSANLTPWILFIIFIFGPCEPLIPLIMYAAAKHNMLSVAVITFVFGLTTILTMLFIVLASFYGLSKLSLGKLERYSNALAGLAILLCGSAIKFLGI